MTTRISWTPLGDMPRPGAAVRIKTSRGWRTGIVGIYGWTDNDGNWRSGTQFPVFWADTKTWGLASRTDVEIRSENP